MQTHKKLLATLVQGARIARLNAPCAKVMNDQRVRIDISVADVNALEAEARAINKKIESLEQQVFMLQVAAANQERVKEYNYDSLDGPMIKMFRD